MRGKTPYFYQFCVVFFTIQMAIAVLKYNGLSVSPH